LIDGDVFRIVVPLDDAYSFNADNDKAQLKRDGCAINCALIEKEVLDYLSERPQATQVELAKSIGKSRRSVQDAIAALKDKGLLERTGAKKNGHWDVKQ
jgi:ATP-dependent DNA helicase RecG